MMRQRKACDDCGRRPADGENWRARRRECDGKSYCPTCRNKHPANKLEHQCSSCRTVKPIDDFYLKHGRPNGSCKGCILATSRLRKYGITQEQVDTLVASQGGRCAICHAEFVVPHVDHCHTTGAIRGALCNECNTGLGMFGDDTARLLRAVNYLGGSDE